MAARAFLLAIEYSEEDVPANGCAVLSALAAPVKHKNKDAAGHCFHDFALKQAGLYGEYLFSVIGPPAPHDSASSGGGAVVCSRGCSVGRRLGIMNITVGATPGVRLSCDCCSRLLCCHWWAPRQERDLCTYSALVAHST